MASGTGDRDGFGNEEFERFKNLKYPKALITGNEKWKDEEFVIYLPKYKNGGKLIVYTIDEKVVAEGYTKTVNGNTITAVGVGETTVRVYDEEKGIYR